MEPDRSRCIDSVSAREPSQKNLADTGDRARCQQRENVSRGSGMHRSRKQVRPVPPQTKRCTVSSSRVSAAAPAPATAPMPISASQNRAAAGCCSVEGMLLAAGEAAHSNATKKHTFGTVRSRTMLNCGADGNLPAPGPSGGPLLRIVLHIEIAWEPFAPRAVLQAYRLFVGHASAKRDQVVAPLPLGENTAALRPG